MSSCSTSWPDIYNLPRTSKLYASKVVGTKSDLRLQEHKNQLSNRLVDEPRVSGESAARQAEFAPRAHSNQRQLTGKLKATFTLEECKILGRIINRFCNFLGASSPLERRLIEKLRRLTASAKISQV